MKRLLICLALAGSAFARVRVVPPVPGNAVADNDAVVVRFEVLDATTFPITPPGIREPREFGSRYWVMVTLTDQAGRVVVLIPQLEESRG